MPASNKLHSRLGLTTRKLFALSVFACLSGCLFSPSKSDSDFALSSRVWDGVAVDSAGNKQSLQGLLRIDFTEGDEVQVQVGNRKGKAPYSVGKSGRLNLGFPDEPLHLVLTEGKIPPVSSAWLPDFIARADRYKEQAGNLYLRSSAYPDVLVTLGKGDTSVALGGVPDPKIDTTKTGTTKPEKPIVVDSTGMHPIKPPPISVDTLKAVLVLPSDFPVYGGSTVPSVRENAFHQVTQAWAQWSQARPEVYSFEYSEKCTCPKLRNGTLTVDGGKVVSFIPAESLTGTVANQYELPNIEALFAQIGLLLTSPFKTGESLKLVFGKYGEPTYLSADMNIASAIDDLSFQVWSLTPKLEIKTPPLVPLDQLIGKVWTVSMVDPLSPGIPAPNIAQIEFFGDGTWSGTFICNSFGGTLAPSPDGQYVFTIEPQTFMECGEKSLVTAFMALVQNPVWVLPNSALDLLLASADGLKMANLKVLSTPR